ncbi:MAG: Crp/Fnr family transcriptional regulator [Clostridiales bacterium]|nr:Crp/Fnr family transcriptional regulator [Clostridiales bacterium]
MVAYDNKFLSRHLSFYDEFTASQRALFHESLQVQPLVKGNIILNHDKQCQGLVLVKRGQLRAYIVSDGGKEITLYRLLAGDSCVMTASCVLKNINFTINLAAEKDSEIYIVPPLQYSKLMESNPVVNKFTLDKMSSRFSDVMWIMEQVVFSSMAKRIASSLLEYSSLEQSDYISTTHENIARDVGTAREVVSRMLKYFESEGAIELSRGAVLIKSYEKLEEISD